MKSFSIKTCLIAVIAVFLLCTCQSKKEEKQIKLVYTNWMESKAFTYLAQEILRKKGYDVELIFVKGDIAKIYSLLAQKDADVFMNAWVPYTHKEFIDEYGHKISKINTNYVNARLGLVVPEYMDIYSIEELAQYDSLLNYTIIGIAKETGYMDQVASAVETYNLKGFHLTYVHELAVIDSLEQAIQKKQPIAVTGWTPHWMFSRYEIKFLDDPHFSFGESQRIDTYAWRGFSEAHPYATSFFSRIQFTDKTIASLLDTFDRIEDPEKAAKTWIENHAIIVNNWLPHE